MLNSKPIAHTRNMHTLIDQTDEAHQSLFTEGNLDVFCYLRQRIMAHCLLPRRLIQVAAAESAAQSVKLQLGSSEDNE